MGNQLSPTKLLIPCHPRRISPQLNHLLQIQYIDCQLSKEAVGRIVGRMSRMESRSAIYRNWHLLHKSSQADREAPRYAPFRDKICCSSAAYLPRLTVGMSGIDIAIVQSLLGKRLRKVSVANVRSSSHIRARHRILPYHPPKHSCDIPLDRDT